MKLSLPSEGLAGPAAILDFLAVRFGYCCHQSAFKVEFIFDHFKHAIRAGGDAFAASVAFVGVNNDEVVSRSVLIAIMSQHLVFSSST